MLRFIVEFFMYIEIIVIIITWLRVLLSLPEIIVIPIRLNDEYI